MRIFLRLFLSILILDLCACSKDEEEDDEVKAATSENAGSIVAAVFGGMGGQLRVNEEREISMCSELDGSGDKSDDGAGASVAMEGDPVEKTFGAKGHTVELGLTDFCLLENGEENPDTDGSDGKGLFTTFVIQKDIKMTCSDGTSAAMGKGSTGVARNTDKHMPEAYGVFKVADTDVTCSMFINEDQSIDKAYCADEDGKELDLASDVTCETSAE